MGNLYITKDHDGDPQTIFEPEVTCPNCKETISDSWEFEDGEEYECDCGAKLIIGLWTEITYSASAVNCVFDDDGEVKLKED